VSTEQVIVTGAGSGIGREFVKLFLADAASVLAVSLRADELDALRIDCNAGDRLRTLVLDLSKHDAAEALVEHCATNDIIVDTLVNNAGFACFGDVVDSDALRLENMIMLNVVTLTKLSTLFGRQMKQRGRGNILNVGSTAGMMATVRFAAYGASKAFVNQFSYALRAELAPTVNVTCLTPGAVSTKFAEAAGIDEFHRPSLLKHWFATGKASSPVDVARAGYRGLRAGEAQVLVGLGSTSAWLASRLLPPSLIPRLVKHF
jgi:short-subunit dehydrogenase